MGVSIIAGGLYGSALLGQQLALRSVHNLKSYAYNPEHIQGDDPAANALRSDLNDIKTKLVTR